MNKGFHPLDQGFDYWFGTKGSNDWDGPGFNYEHFRDTPEDFGMQSTPPTHPE